MTCSDQANIFISWWWLVLSKDRIPLRLMLWGASCYTKILSPSCDKNFDIPTCPESQLLEWKPMLIINLSWKFSAPHFPCCLGVVPCSHHLSLFVHKQCHCLWPFVHKHFLLEPLCHWRRNAVPWVKREKEKFLKDSRWWASCPPLSLSLWVSWARDPSS